MSDDSEKVVRDLLPKGWSMDSTIDDETHKCVSVYRVKDDKEAAHTLWALSADASDKFNLPDRVFDRAKALADHRLPHVEGPTFCRKKTTDGVQWCVICSPEPPSSADTLELQPGRKADRKTAARIIHDVLIGLGALHKAFAGLDPPAHCALRLNRVGLRNLWNGHRHATLLDAPVGPLSSWTKGEYLDGAEADGVRGTAWPTGAKDKVPKVENDIYAVGAMWAALLNAHLQSDKSWRKLDGATTFALKRMLADQADSRPSVARALDLAVAAIDANSKPTLWTALRRPFGNWLVRIAGLLLLVPMGGSAVLWWQADGDRANLERQLADCRNGPPGSIPPPPDPCAVVGQALKTWIGFLEFQDVNAIRQSITQISATGDREQGDILRLWLDKATTGRVWNLRVGPAKAPYDRKWRDITINDTSDFWKNYDWPNNDWDDRHHGPKVQLRGKGWKAGETLELLLEGNSGTPWWPNKNLIEVTIDGPLALYKLVYDGAHQGQNFIHFEFDDLNAAFPLPKEWKITWENCEWAYDFRGDRKTKDMRSLEEQIRNQSSADSGDPIGDSERTVKTELGL